MQLRIDVREHGMESEYHYSKVNNLKTRKSPTYHYFFYISEAEIAIKLDSAIESIHFIKNES